jgi:hypothetical protein
MTAVRRDWAPESVRFFSSLGRAQQTDSSMTAVTSSPSATAQLIQLPVHVVDHLGGRSQPCTLAAIDLRPVPVRLAFHGVCRSESEHGGLHGLFQYTDPYAHSRPNTAIAESSALCKYG